MEIFLLSNGKAIALMDKMNGICVHGRSDGVIRIDGVTLNPGDPVQIPNNLNRNVLMEYVDSTQRIYRISNVSAINGKLIAKATMQDIAPLLESVSELIDRMDRMELSLQTLDGNAPSGFDMIFE